MNTFEKLDALNEIYSICPGFVFLKEQLKYRRRLERIAKEENMNVQQAKEKYIPLLMELKEYNFSKVKESFTAIVVAIIEANRFDSFLSFEMFFQNFIACKSHEDTIKTAQDSFNDDLVSALRAIEDDLSKTNLLYLEIWISQIKEFKEIEGK